MKIKTKFNLGILLIIILITSGIYISFDDKVKIYVDNDKTTFYSKIDSRWLVSGREYNKLFDGSSQLYRDVDSIEIKRFNDSNKFTIQRYTSYKKGPLIIDEYVFDGDIEDIKQFPISHTVKIVNGSGYFYRYEVKDLQYNGVREKLFVNNMNFGYNMKVEWQTPYRWAWIYASGTLRIQYDIESNYEEFQVRLFDPPTIELLLEGFNRNITAELGSHINISTNITDNETVCIDVDHPQGGINLSCGTNITQYDLNITYFQETSFSDDTTITSINLTEIPVQVFEDILPVGIPLYDNIGYAEKFLNEQDVVITSFDLNLFSNDGENLTLEYALISFDDNNISSIMEKGFINESLIPAFGGWINIPLTIPQKLTKEQYYGVGLYVTGGNISEIPSIVIFYSTGDNYSLGHPVKSVNNIDNWIDPTLTRDFGFRINSFRNVLNVSSHQYDEVINLSLNLQGFEFNGSFPDDVKIYINDTLSNVIGPLFNTTNFSISKFSDGDTFKTITYSEEETQTIGFFPIQKDASVSSAIFTLNGSSSVNDNLGLPETPYVILEANNISSIGDFQINDVNISSFIDTKDGNTTKWVIYAISGDHQIRRAKIMKTLFYGTDGSDPRADNGTYIIGLTAIKTSEIKDIGKKAFYFESLEHHAGRRNVGETHIVIYNITNAGLSNSIWSYNTARTQGTSGEDEIRIVINLGNPVFSSCFQELNTATKTCDNTGTDQSIKEQNSPSFIRFKTAATDDGGTISFKSYLLTEGDITIQESEPDWTISLTNFVEDHGIPAFTAWYDFAVTNPWMKAGILNGSQDWNYTGDFNISETTNNFNLSINTFLDSCIADEDNLCQVPIYLFSEDTGVLIVKDIEINYTYNPNPILLSTSIIQSYLNNSVNSTNITIIIESSTNGSVTASNLDYRHRGGNDTIEVKAHNTNYTINESFYITYYYSDWQFKLPSKVSFIEFLPSRVNSKNVTPYKQRSNIPIINITATNYGGKNFDFSLFKFETDQAEPTGCVNITVRDNNNKSNGFIYQENANSFIFNETWQISNKPFLYDRLWDNDLYAISTVGNIGIYQFNYTKPDNVLNTSLLRIQDAHADSPVPIPEEVNLTIPSSCWNYDNDTLIFRVTSDFDGSDADGTTNSKWDCFNGSWINMRTKQFNLFLGEEAMWWSYGPIINDTWNILNKDSLYLDNFGLWMWADYECDYSNWFLWSPTWDFRACAVDVDVCSEENSGDV